MKKLVQTLFTIYVLIIFVVVTFPGYLLVILAWNVSGKKGFENAVTVTQYWAKVFLLCIFMPVVSKGRKHINKKATYIFISNHTSQLDIPASLYAAPQPYKFLSKKEVEKMPMINYQLRRLHLLVDRSSRESRSDSFMKMKQCLKSGISLIIFAEGTRNPGPALTKEFYDGAFKLAVETGTPIVVQTLVNTYSRQSAHMGFRMNPGRIMAIFDKPIKTSLLTDADIPKLKEQVRQIMEHHMQKHYGTALPVNN